MSYLKEKYQEEIVPALMKEYNYKNVMQVPHLTKISLNMGVGEAVQNPKALDHALEELTAIAGQKPIITKARKSIAGFKLRAGNPIGCCVTLHGNKAYEFLERLIHVALPRVRDFRGVSTASFDGRGNYTFGIVEQIIFPEVNYEKTDKIRGLSVCINTNARTDEEAKSLLSLLGMPFRKK